MEAARIPWRPLGRLLVEQGLLTADELEHALAQQERTGRRLGETLVDCGFVSGPELSNALAAQYGIELTAETGFGTGLRTVIQQRHETDRGRVVRAVPSADDPAEPSTEAEPQPEGPELEAPPPGEQLLHAQLEEQWAKLAAAEERLAESHRELTALAHEYDERRSQAARLARRARHAREQHGSGHEQDERIAHLEGEVRGRVAEIDRLRSECVGLRDELAGTEAAAEERLSESHRELVALACEYDRRRGQAARLAQRARHAREVLGFQHEHDERIAHLEEDVRGRDAELDRLRDLLAGAEAASAEHDRLLEGQRREATRRRAQAARLLERTRRATASEGQLADKLTTVEQRLAESHRELTALAREYDHRQSQAARFVHRVRERDMRIERLSADVQGCDAEIGRLRDESERTGYALAAAEAAVVERDRLLDKLRHESERRRAQAVRFLARLRNAASEPAPDPPPDSHVVFVQLAGRYELFEREGPPPLRNAVLELPELCDAAVVARIGRSPLPGDTRPCVFVQPGS